MTAAGQADKENEFVRDRAWRVVLASLVGCALGLTALPFYTLGLFAAPLVAEFGWSRATVQGAISAVMAGVLVSAWLAGWLIDRIGVRRVAIASQVGLAIGFALLTLQGGDRFWWFANWVVIAVLGVGTTPLSWSRGIAGWFRDQRGLALGIALSGTGVTAFAAPLVLTPFIAAHGWRAGYGAIAAAILLIGVPVAALLFRERPAAPAVGAPAVGGEGATLGEAVRGRRFWVIAAAFALVTSAVAGTIPNLVPLLTESGLPLATAAAYASLLGLAVIGGRLIAGWLLDRYWAPAVAVGILTPPAAACLLLTGPLWPGFTVVLIGLAGGAEFDLIAYLCLRYFGTRNYGQIYGWQWAMFSAASGIGPAMFGLIRDRTGSYDPALLAAAGLMIAGPLLLLTLGRYPDLRKDPA